LAFIQGKNGVFPGKWAMEIRAMMLQ